MLQEHAPAHRADPDAPSPPRPRWQVLAGPIAVGLVGLLTILVAVDFRIHRDDDRATTRGPSAPATATRAGPAPTRAAAGKPATARPGKPAAGAQLWAKSPLGGIHQDQGSSIPLPDGRTLWIFADTFQLNGTPTFFNTSSAGVTDPGAWQLRYASSKHSPTEFLPRTGPERADRLDGDHYQAVWPTGSTLLPNGRIIISYAKYRVLVKQKDYQLLGSGLFEYRYRSLGALQAGGHARRIASDLWTAKDGEVRSPVYADGYVYFMHCQDLRCQSLRTTPARLTDRTSYRWWTGSGWSENPYHARDLSFGSSHPGGNASMVRLPGGGYAMADTEVGSAAGSGLLWVAPNPWGPWSQAAGFDFPRCPAGGCYGLNLHPEQSPPGRLRVSYATNGLGPFVRVVDLPVSISPDRSAILVR